MMEGYPSSMNQRQGPSPLVIIGIVMVVLACLCIGTVGGGMLFLGPQISEVFDQIERELNAAPGIVPTTVAIAPVVPQPTAVPQTGGQSSGQTGGQSGGQTGSQGGSGQCDIQSPNAGFTGTDGYTTTFVGCVEFDISSPETYIGSLSEAHNWLFYGSAGQEVRIRVGGTDGIDPRVNLIDPQGNVIDRHDDDVEYNVDFTITLPSSGLYVIRIDIFNEGNYTVLVEAQ